MKRPCLNSVLSCEPLHLLSTIYSVDHSQTKEQKPILALFAPAVCWSHYAVHHRSLAMADASNRTNFARPTPSRPILSASQEKVLLLLSPFSISSLPSGHVFAL